MTAKRKREIDSSDTESELLSILQSTRDLVIRYDERIRILFFNHAAERMYRELLGVTLEVGLCTYDVFPAEHRPYWDGINKRVLGGESFTEALTIPDQSGTLRSYEVDYHPTRRGNAVIGFTTFAREVTEARAQEAALREKHKLESIGVLAGGIAHDFNNLLAAMLGNISLAFNETQAGSQASIYLRSAEDAALRAADLTRQMLSYAGRAPTLTRPLNMSALVDEMVQLLRASVPKNVALTIEPAARTAWVHGDPAQVQQVLLNLVTNGADAVGPGPGSVQVRVSHTCLRTRTKSMGGLTLEPGNYVVLVVADDGCGIDEQVRERMFDPFFTTKPRGRGLGLSAMLGILRSHRAGIEVASTVGQGSCFRVLIPEGSAPAAQAVAPVESTIRLTGRVLLADDDPQVLSLMRVLLEGLGFEVVSAVDGIEALAKGRSGLTELQAAVLDVSMPGLGGREVATALRRLRPDLPVVFASGFPGDDVMGSLQDGLTWFLAKPFRAGELCKLMNRALGA